MLDETLSEGVGVLARSALISGMATHTTTKAGTAEPSCSCPEGGRDPLCELAAFRNREQRTRRGVSAAPTPLTTAELVAELQRLDPEGKRLVLLEPAVGPASLAVGARPVTLWDGENCIAVGGQRR